SLREIFNRWFECGVYRWGDMRRSGASEGNGEICDGAARKMGRRRSKLVRSTDSQMK
ncbi:hypothetical protein FRC16_005740, partial [Serendipita sp. 398]